MKDLRAALQQRQQEQLLRRRKLRTSPSGTDILLDGRPVINFCSNDYLGLANHPEVVQRFKQGADHYGVGSGSAHLINGHTGAHHALEEELADFLGYEAALLFSTGYMANLGIAQALCQKGDHIYADRLNHASLLDASLLSGARLLRYRHGDIADLEKRIGNEEREKLIMTDGVFSMDGDIAPLPELVRISQRKQAWLMMDDAHGFGVLGDQGRGSLEHLGVATGDVPIFMATLGKALGTAGAFVAGSRDLVDYLVQQARTFVYTTAMPPAIAEASRTSLTLMRDGELRRKLGHNIAFFRRQADQRGIELMPSETAIQPLLLGDAGKALDISQRLLEQGFHVSAIRPPTVPEGTARLRITLSASHSETQISLLLEALASLLPA